jgi:hypothetical protein
MNNELLRHLEDERDWLRNRLSVISQQIAQMYRAQPAPATSTKATIVDELRDMVVPRS